jgi:hypothetical protein
VVPLAAKLLRTDRLSAGAVFVGAAAIFFVLPAISSPTFAKGMLLVLGWDMMLSSYSYCVETSKTLDEPSWRDCCFFLLVNPTLVYAQRGAQVEKPRLHFPSLGRCGFALLQFFLVSAIILPLYYSVKEQSSSPASSLSQLPALTARGALRFFVEYWRQAGLASFQIGLLRQLGHVIPERFLGPPRSLSLPDFWRRWNTYVGQWLLRYLFWPLSLWLARRFISRRFSTFAKVIGVLASFGTIGILHDVYPYALNFTIQTEMSGLFVLNGILVLLCLASSLLWQALTYRVPLPEWAGIAASVISRAFLWAVVIGSFSTLGK